MLAVIRTMSAYHADGVLEVVILDVFPQSLADFLAATLFALLACADVVNFGGRVLLLAHRAINSGKSTKDI